MAAITKPKAGSIRKVTRDKRQLAANVNAIKGGLAAAFGGYYRPATGAPGEVVRGRFFESVSNVGGAAGAKSCEIEFFKERALFLVENDGGAPIVVANREGPCSILDDQTATLFTQSKGVGAVVYDVISGEGVWIQMPSSGTTPGLQSGTVSLVAGTATVTGVVLTSTSRILVSIKDAGAGAITAFADLEVPSASRNVGAGSFVINAINASKAVINTATPDVDYLIVG
jgi:hypothetical protein